MLGVEIKQFEKRASSGNEMSLFNPMFSPHVWQTDIILAKSTVKKY